MQQSCISELEVQDFQLIEDDTQPDAPEILAHKPAGVSGDTVKPAMSVEIDTSGDQNDPEICIVGTGADYGA